ncbi:MAG: hypothetical protein Q8K58_13690 [Acidimicrobiales bacterium]|nr:hypothetical protein [Acidimicrobiales bacterium]
MPADIEPPELARLADFAERSRAADWSLRSALCRYAQPQPQQVSDVLDLARRIEAALHPHQGLLRREGRALWAMLEGGSGPAEADPADPVVALLAVMVELDRLGDLLAAWADDRAAHDPQPAVAATVSALAQRLEALGVPHEERPRPSGTRG